MYQKLIDEIENDIIGLQQLYAAINTLPKLEGVFHMQVCDRDTIILSMPHNMEVFKVNQARLVEAGWKLNGINPSYDATCAIAKFYQGENWWTGKVISIHLYTGVEGATCKRTLLGYEQRPVYEITCLEA